MLIATICLAVVFGVVFTFDSFLNSGDDSSSPTLQENVIRVACIGDSITAGYGIENRGHNSYPAQLQILLEDEYQVLNYGLIGRTLQKGGDLPYTIERLYTISLDAEPHIVLIMLGTNDAHPNNWNASSYEKELEGFVKIYQDLDSAPVVYLMRPPPIYRTQLSHMNVILTHEVLPIIERVAEKRRVQMIDIFSVFDNHEEFFSDGVHPNAFGAKIIAEAVYDAIKPVGVSYGTS
jgi:lysophospholipase L1-like esterase